MVQANAEAAEALQRRNLAQQELQPAEQELNRICVEEIRLRKQIAGEAYVDPELGLVTRRSP